MIELIDLIRFVDSQIAYHENQVNWALQDPQKKNRHNSILQNFQNLNNYLLSSGAIHKPLTLKSTSDNPNAEASKTAGLTKKTTKNSNNSSKIDSSDPSINASSPLKSALPAKSISPPITKNKCTDAYSSEYISKQPKSKQIEYQILNIISCQNSSATCDHIASELYKKYDIIISRGDLARPLNRLIKDNKIERISKGNYRTLKNNQLPLLFR